MEFCSVTQDGPALAKHSQEKSPQLSLSPSSPFPHPMPSRAPVCSRYSFLLFFNILNSQPIVGFGFQVFESRAFSYCCVL